MLLLQVLYDPLLIISYLIYYIILYCWLWWKYYSFVGVGVAGWIYYYIVAGGVTSCSGGVVGDPGPGGAAGVDVMDN